MKKIVIFIGLLISVLAFGQNTNPLNSYVISFDMSTITGTDTVLYYYTTSGRTDELNAFGGSIGVEVEYKSLDDNDATLDIGRSISGYGFESVDTSMFPVTLSTADSTLVSGSKPTSTSSYEARQVFRFNDFPFEWMPLKITLGSVTEGTLNIWIKQQKL